MSEFYQPAVPVSVESLEKLGEKIIRLERELNAFHDELSKAMPSDYKDWWQNSKEEWPIVARLTIENLREREQSALEYSERLERELNDAKRELTEAGWTHEPGAPRWKPPVNREMGKLWNRLFEAERERDEAREKLAGKVHAGAVCIASREYIEGIERERDEALAKIEATASLKVDLGNRNAEICKLRAINAESEKAIVEFCDGTAWAVDEWKKEPHIKPLFDIAAKSKQSRNG
jgi:hypothetical protein